MRVPDAPYAIGGTVRGLLESESGKKGKTNLLEAEIFNLHLLAQ